MDREKTEDFKLVVRVSDLAMNVKKRKSTTFTTHLMVFDVNDNAPVFTSVNSTYVFEDDQPGTVLATIQAHDPDEGKTHTSVMYEIIDGDDFPKEKFTIDFDTGVLKTKRNLDIRARHNYVLTIKAIEYRSEKHKSLGIDTKSATTKVNVEVYDVNNNDPVFTSKNYDVEVNEAALVDSEVFKVKATDADYGTNAEVKYALSDNNDVFVIEPTTGAILLKKQLDRETQDLYIIHATVRNTVYPFGADSCSIKIR
jgi:hypothetical protein